MRSDLTKNLRERHSSLVTQSFLMSQAADEIDRLIKDREDLRNQLVCMVDIAERRLFEIERLTRELAEARDRGLEDAAVWHDYQISDLEEQIARNNEYRSRTGSSSAASEANDFCRSLQSNHRISAASIRALKEKT